MNSYIYALIISAGISLGLAPIVKRLAVKIGAVDQPVGGRKIHLRPTPRLGGLAIAPAFILTALLLLSVNRHLIGLILGSIILLIVGIIDDRRGLSPWVKLFWQVLAAMVALAGGIGITAITNPLGGSLDITWLRTAINLGPLSFHITPVANLLSIIWIVGLVNAVNFLDGIDGLACGVSAIASFFIFALAVSATVNQPAVALLAIALFGAAIGFLPFNSFPAKMFLGDSGAYFLGLVLALLAIYSGGKLATAALVLGFTIVDGLITVLRRLYHRSSPFKADRSHLHHLLLDFGLSQRQTVLLYYFTAILLGLLALLSGTLVKLTAILILTLATALLVGILIKSSKGRPTGKA
jgi:UDP-GlcNAc:undecaprenyl-phosphate GlcNAc-1-phosphate transferase